MNNPPTMSQFTTELDCLRARDKWFQQELASIIAQRDALKVRVESINRINLGLVDQLEKLEATIRQMERK